MPFFSLSVNVTTWENQSDHTKWTMQYNRKLTEAWQPGKDSYTEQRNWDGTLHLLNIKCH